ncbi:hypothetical protein B0J17DRAFT_668880 [Rhizoctonia solani]|nr:hypothetical protein B0J17DRAFT_668880 [Rhizoctonia solani]
MRTQEDSTLFDSDSERGDDWETELDCDSKGSQHGLNNAPKLSGSLPDDQDHKDPANATPPIDFGVRYLRDAVMSVCNLQVVKFLSILCLVFLALGPESPTKSLCKIPVLSGYTSHCARELDLPRKPVATPDFITLARLQSRLEQVMKDSASSSKVAVDIKDSEMALRDLGTVVKHSALSKKDILGRDLKSFVNDAKAAGASLQQFGSRVWGAVDRIVSLNEHTLLILESTSTAGEGNSGSSGWWGRKGGEVASRVPDPKEMENIWLQGVFMLDQNLRKLIHEAQHNIGSLQRLEEKLNSIADMVAEEKHEIMDKELALKQQWFRELFGMNNGEWHSHSMSHALLERVKNNRQDALNHVTGVLLKLKQMSNDLDDLREGVATPLIIPASSNIPIEAHIKSIRGATERLVNGQTNMREIEDGYRREKFSE